VLMATWATEATFNNKAAVIRNSKFFIRDQDFIVVFDRDNPSEGFKIKETNEVVQIVNPGNRAVDEWEME